MKAAVKQTLLASNLIIFQFWQVIGHFNAMIENSELKSRDIYESKQACNSVTPEIKMIFQRSNSFAT